MQYGIKFSELVSLVNISLYVSNAGNSRILQYQGPILQVCDAHPIKLIVT